MSDSNGHHLMSTAADEKRRMTVARYLNRGVYSPEFLAGKMGVAVSVIHNDLKVLTERYVQMGNQEMAEAKGQELAYVFEVQRRYEYQYAIANGKVVPAVMPKKLMSSAACLKGMLACSRARLEIKGVIQRAGVKIETNNFRLNVANQIVEAGKQVEQQYLSSVKVKSLELPRPPGGEKDWDIKTTSGPGGPAQKPPDKNGDGQ